MSSPKIKQKNGVKFKVDNPSEKPMRGPPSRQNLGTFLEIKWFKN